MISLLVVFALSIVSVKAFRALKSKVNLHGGFLTAISPEGMLVQQANASSSMISIMGVRCLTLLRSDCSKCPRTCEQCFQCDESGCHQCTATPMNQVFAQHPLTARPAPRLLTTCSPDSDALCEETGFAKNYCNEEWLLRLAPTGLMIGSGSYGSVIAIRTIAGEPAMVAVKKFERRDNMSMAAAEAEIELLMKLKNAFIVRGFGHGNVNGFRTVVMEFAEYGSLNGHGSVAVLASASGDFYKGLAVITIQILKALEYLHGQGIMHGDIKLDNILLTSHRIEPYVVAKLGDLGCALSLQNNSYMNVPMVAEKEKWGTPIYNSPEFLTGNIPSESDERWAFGIVIFILAHKHQKYPQHFNPPTRKNRAERMMSMIRGIKSGSEQEYFTMPPDVSRHLKALVHGLLTVDLRKRLTIAGAIQKAILWANEEGIDGSVIT